MVTRRDQDSPDPMYTRTPYDGSLFQPDQVGERYKYLLKAAIENVPSHH
jgi:hypothetical protein